MIRPNRQKGFTFVEVMVAVLLFTLAVVAAVSIAQGSVRATLEAKEMSTATWLLQNAMTELETRLETEGIEKGCEKKKDGKFPPPYEKYMWTSYCNEVDFRLSESAAKITKNEEDESNIEQENLIQKMILQMASDYMTKAIRELHTEVTWQTGKQKKSVNATTHFARYDLPITLPGVGAKQ